MKKQSIIIPAHNEQDRIGVTLEAYGAFFAQKEQEGKVASEVLVVLNGCSDNTAEVVKKAQERYPSISMIDLQAAGKGLAIIAGFADALERQENDFIGFVDADMATEPHYYYELFEKLGSHDGLIASRYMPASKISPARPWIKSWGRKIVYNTMVRALFDITYVDYQCGAKLFKREVVASIVHDMQEGQWAFDVEVLYLAKKHGFSIGEIPTVWVDKEGSKLATYSSGIKMLRSLFELKRQHANKEEGRNKW